MSTTQPASAVGPYARGAGRFAMIVGFIIILWWAWLLVTDDVPDLYTRPVAMWFHIAGEVTTAAILIIAGYGMLAATTWARKLYLVATGMLLLVVIHAVAWYGSHGDFPMVVLFCILAVLAVFFALRAEE